MTRLGREGRAPCCRVDSRRGRSSAPARWSAAPSLRISSSISGRGQSRAPHCCDQRRTCRSGIPPVGRSPEADGAIVDGMQAHQCLDQLADAPAISSLSANPAGMIGEHHAGAIGHDVEGHLVHRWPWQRAIGRATGTSVSATLSTRYSRPMSCAVGNTWPSGRAAQHHGPPSPSTR
jgi:hypothetical protein